MSAAAARAPRGPGAPQSFLECLRHFLTPQLWKQAHGALTNYAAIRWTAQPLLFVLLVMTWCAGDSLAERFETARAFYVASYQRQRRPGKTPEGFHKALARLPVAALRRVAAAVRARLEQVFAGRLLVDGFVPLGCDGTRLNCPRTPELERRLRAKPQSQQPPTILVSAFVHLPLGVLWSWRLGGPCASERDHLARLLPTLPRLALVVADAGYVGYELLQKLVAARRSFLIRLSSKAPLYTTGRVAFWSRREGLAYYWPKEVQEAGQAPVAVRVLRLRGRKAAGRKQGDIWLMTDVLEAAQLPRATASKFYRWRWRNEGVFRTYKRTLGKVKLMGRTVAQVHREAEGSLLAVQLLLAQGALALQGAGLSPRVLPSARQVLLAMRAEIRDVTGMYLGPRQRQTYWQRLRRLRVDRRRKRHNQVRRRWPGRADHKPPKPPKIRTMGTRLKELLARTLGNG
jgi:Transposase DDE domain